MGRNTGKRFFDLTLAVPVLVFSLPLQAGIAILIARTLGRPVLFRQLRPGLHGEAFELLKFRTMRDVDPARGLIDDASRMTNVGRVLRSTSLDELPSLWNVIRGDMSLVGPRPLLMEYLPRYSAEQAQRHNVRPGITGLAQVSGRNALAWEERLQLDIDYVANRSLLLDLRILVRTVIAVLGRNGIQAPGHVTAHKFTGTGAGDGE